MTQAGMAAYRREVRQEPCTDCGAGEGENCKVLSLGPRYGSDTEYVHDGRSFRHFTRAQAAAFGTDNPYGEE